MKRRLFVTVTYQATTMKSASVKIDGQTVEWGEKLGAFFVRPSSRLTLRLNILIGTHEIRLPVGPTDQSFNLLSEGNNRQAGESTRPVTLHLTVTMSANRTPSPGSLIDVTKPTAAGAGNPTTENVDVHPTSQGTLETAGAVFTKLPLSRTDRISVESMPGTGAYQSGPSTLITTEHETTIDDIIKEVKRFRILSIGRSGVGKSTLINSIFGIDAAHVEDYKPGKADIQQEFGSAENPFFVLHDSKGFEPGDLVNFETVCEFIQQRSQQDLPLSERIHGLWLCIETPTAGSRVLERGDEELLQFAHKNQLPIVVVFTQYDRLEWTKEDELREREPHMDPTHRRNQSVVDAQKAFDLCLRLLKLRMKNLGVPMPCHARVSVRPGRQEDVSSLVKATQDIVKERVKGDAWVMWAISQRKSLPLKIQTCLTRALMDSVPGLGQLFLRNCLEKVHNNIVTCWNFKGEVLNSPKFQQQMLGLVHDVHTEPNVSILRNVNVNNQYLTSVTTASAPILPPITIQSPVEIFVEWLSKTVLENVPSVQRVLIVYTVDLVSILVELFGITLRPELAFRTDWTELQAAFEAYERSSSRQRIRESIFSKTTWDNGILTVDGIDKKLHELLQEQIEMPPSK
ncbi:hypothetical protein EDB92DRAFT_1871368 [Lactarius akahatsu]|uniref:G domain-containing protein n=1 Tax=Lactarius akahatsu TaxID=416441 RepID=A0AAD4Q6R1_9AGAM|nr:hypothetical protein EDB92DRAFT_1871368 [Lactarius akahatsu]